MGHGFRDTEMEQSVLEIIRRIGIGVQSGGKYFCHDVRVIRLTLMPTRIPLCGQYGQAGLLLQRVESSGLFVSPGLASPPEGLPSAGADPVTPLKH